jgi:catechol-2,3-dioxygenase
MAILSGIPVLNCQSIDATLNFYQQLLQFVVVKKRQPDGRLHWVHIMHGNTTLMLQAADQVVPPDTNQLQHSNITLYFFINNIRELHHFIKVKYGNVSDIVSTDYHMQEFSLKDPEGNKITMGQKS